MFLAEPQTEWIINNNLVNKGWCIDSNSEFKNVYFQKPPYPDQQKKLKGKKPDYILYQTGTSRAIAIIEAKKSGINLEPALRQGTEYAKALDISLVFAMNGAYCETRFVPNNKELILNGDEVRELVREEEVLEFLNANSNEAWTIPQEIKASRDNLISQFRNLNDILRSEGLRAGIERFSEFANILFLKLLSEDDKKSWWNSIKLQSNDDIIGYINSYVIEQIQNKYGGNVFTPISIKNPQTLRHIINVIDPLVLSTIDTDIKGDAFEYFLEKTTSTENDLGEYFTPRNIVRTIISLVDPKFKETIYDPFCGTGGFLTEAFNYIKENNIIEDENDLERLKHKTLYGGEITTTARIAKMNMILHGDGHSGVKPIDSLAHPVNDKHDVVITNMPFSQIITRKTTENGKTKIENKISPLYYNGIAKNSGDSACVLHCLRALKKGGRMALVVPEGFLFRKEETNVRKFLLSKAKLQSVISLPQGTFLPYTGAKTDILYFTDAHKPNTQKNYWFFDAQNIGVTLDSHKKKIKGENDLKKIESSDIRKIDKNPDLQDSMIEIGFEIVDLKEVKNNNYNLVGNTYRSNVNRSKYLIVPLSEIASVLIGNSAPQDNKYFENGTHPFFRVSDLAKSHITNSLTETKTYINDLATEEMRLFKKGTILFPKSGAASLLNHRGILGVDGYVVSHMSCIIANESKILTKYLFFILMKINAKDVVLNPGYPSIRKSDIEKIEIPLPSIPEQKRIIEFIEQEEKKIQLLTQKIEKSEQSISQKINQVWQ